MKHFRTFGQSRCGIVKCKRTLIMPRQNLAPNEAKRRRREQAKTGMRRLRREARERAEERLAAERRAVLASSSSETESESLVDTEEDDSDVAEGLAGDMEENLNIGGLDNQPQHLLVQGNEENAIAMQAHGEDYDEIVPPLQPIPFLSNTAVPQEEKLKELCRALAAVKAQTMTSESGMDKFLKVMVSRSDTVKELVDENLLGCSYRRSVKPVAIAGTPTFRYSVYLEDERTDPPSYHLIDNLTKIPQEYINLGPNDKRTVLCQTGYTSLAEIKRFHRKVLASRGVPHEKFLWDCQHLDLSVDGVRETNTGRRTFHIMSVRLGGNIYMYRIFNPLIGNPLAKPDLEAVYRPFVNELLEDPELRLRNVICDTPERRFAKGLIGQAGRYSCENCTVAAVTVPSTHWPPRECQGGELRTEEEFQFSARNLDDPQHDHQGVNACSPLLDVPPPFSILWNIPMEEFHLIKEGLGKLIIKRLFEARQDEESRALLDEWTQMYERMEVFSETGRHTRRIHTAQLKGSELGVIVYTAFPALALILKDGKGKHLEPARKCVAIFAFLCRAYNVESDRYEEIKDDLRAAGTSYRDLHKRFYECFQEGMCWRKRRCTTNVHAFYHLHEVRERTQQPLHEPSTEDFESQYAIVRRSFHGGTRNTPKQVLENMYMRLMHSSHHGRKGRLVVSASKDRNRKRDSLVKLRDGSIVEVFRDDVQPMQGYRMKTSPYNPLLALQLPWASVGVHFATGYDYSTKVEVRREDVVAKYMMCGNIICEWQQPWLSSKVDN